MTAGLAAALLLAGCDAAAPTAAREQPANVAALAATATPPEAAGDFPALTGRVVDQAELLSPADEARLTADLAELERRTTDQLVIVTLRSLDGLSIEEYGRSLGNHWGIGRAEADNGVLILVVPSERTTRIEVGAGLETILTDERAQEIVDRDLLPNFRESRWSAGLDAGARAIIATLIEHEREPRRGRR